MKTGSRCPITLLSTLLWKPQISSTSVISASTCLRTSSISSSFDAWHALSVWYHIFSFLVLSRESWTLFSFACKDDSRFSKRFTETIFGSFLFSISSYFLLVFLRSSSSLIDASCWNSRASMTYFASWRHYFSISIS